MDEEYLALIKSYCEGFGGTLYHDGLANREKATFRNTSKCHDSFKFDDGTLYH